MMMTTNTTKTTKRQVVRFSIERNGNPEIVESDKYGSMNDTLFGRLQQAQRNLNDGVELIGYELAIIAETVELTLADQRNELVAEVTNTYSPDHFPGTPEWYCQVAAEKALNTFDVEHPEIIGELRAARDEQVQETAKKAGWI